MTVRIHGIIIFIRKFVQKSILLGVNSESRWDKQHLKLFFFSLVILNSSKQK